MTRTRAVTGVIAAVLATGVYFMIVNDLAERPRAQAPTQAFVPFAREHVVHDARRSAPSNDVVSPGSEQSVASELGFEWRPNGELIIDDATRDVVEEISAVTDAADLHEIRVHLQRTLPSPAGESAADLVERYYRYRIALDEQLRADEMAEQPGDPSNGLEALQALRTEFFGAELAGLWFGKDEAISRAVIARDERAR